LEELRAIAAQRRCLDSRERETLAAARRNGATLDNIAKSLGISKQAVHQRLKNLGSLQLLLVGSWAQDLAGDFASRLG
jgi:predicted ArsR family transcriptional regulator